MLCIFVRYLDGVITLWKILNFRVSWMFLNRSSIKLTNIRLYYALYRIFRYDSFCAWRALLAINIKRYYALMCIYVSRRTKRKRRVRPGNSLYFFLFFFLWGSPIFLKLGTLKVDEKLFFLIFENCDVTIFKYEKNRFLCRNFGNFGSKSRARTGLFFGIF